MIIVQGGDEAFDALAFGEQNPSNQSFLSSFFQGDIGEKGTSFFADFAHRAKARYEAFNSDEAIILGKAALNQVRGYFTPNTIRFISDLAGLQVAGDVMQRWIMANPTVRRMYHAQQCDGYSETYVDREPGKVGEDHYDYRMLMNGIVEEDADGNITHTQYMEDLIGDDQPLHAYDQFSILATNELAEHFMKAAGKDCTNIWNGDL